MIRSIALSLLALAMGCPKVTPVDDLDDDPPPPVAPGDSTTRMIDVGGGTLELGGLTLTVPPGALAEPTEIRIVVTERSAPTAFNAFSPIFRFEPAGLEFAEPATVTLPYDGDPEVATVFWTDGSSSAFAARPTEASRYYASATISHFSQGFVGTACEDCCRRATDALDVLLMVDNSGSMTEEQASLAAEIPGLVEALATGDVDGDGVQDFPVVSALRIGVVSSDMGAGDDRTPSCTTAGDDGILLTAGMTADPSCDASYPSWLDGDLASSPEALAGDVSCVARVGTAGCGFEQQLDAMLKALTPASSAVRFANGSSGHGDGANVGFLRPDGVLALISLTDEDDCSAADPALFDLDSPMYTGGLNLRCFTHPEAVHPVSRFVDGFLDLKEDPTQLVYATIAGIPADLEGQPLEAVLLDERMQEEVDPSFPERLRPSCDVPGRGMAFPPRRMVETARELESAGAKAVAASICNESFSGAVAAILERVAAGVSGSCR